MRGKKPRTKYTWRGRSTAASGSGRSILQSQLAMPGKSFFGGEQCYLFFIAICHALSCSTLLPPGDFDLEAYVRFFPGVAIFTTKRKFIYFLSDLTDRLIYTLAQRPVCEKDLFWRRKRVFVMQGTTAPDGPQCLQSGGWLMCWGGGMWGAQITSWRANHTIICPRNDYCRSNNHKFI